VQIPKNGLRHSLLLQNAAVLRHLATECSVLRFENSHVLRQHRMQAEHGMLRRRMLRAARDLQERPLLIVGRCRLAFRSGSSIEAARTAYKCAPFRRIIVSFRSDTGSSLSPLY
jgi:hypothetical protein